MRFRLLYVVPTLTLLVAVVFPLIVGVETLFYRDVLSTHLPFKASQAWLLEAGEALPLVDPYRSGQALLGNPNALVLYPTSLLLAFAGPLWTLNAHFWIHLLLAPLAGFWLGRAWGLERPGAWCVGTVYAASGFFLSLMNLFNMVAGAALAPAFIAACLSADASDDTSDNAADRRARRLWVSAAGLWALMVLGGDPVLGVTTWGLAALALILRRPTRRHGLRRAARLAMATVAGSLLALPQIVETLRILPRSFRGHVGFSDSTVLVQSWHPATFLEQLSPLLFGSTGPGYWGQVFQNGREPLILSLHVGWIALALAASASFRARFPGARAARWAAGAVGLGVFLALGSYNPLVEPLLALPGASFLRYPIRMWSLATLGLAVLAGVGFDRLRGAPSDDSADVSAENSTAASPTGGATWRYRAVLATGLMLVGGALVGVFLPGAPSIALVQRLTPEDSVPAFLATEGVRWTVTWGLVTLTLAAALLLSFLSRRTPQIAAAATLLLHLGSQLLLLDPLLATDAAAPYLEEPPIAAFLPLDERIVSGRQQNLFAEAAPVAVDPTDPVPAAGARARHLDATTAHGILLRRRYALALSPEVLDSFYTVAFARAFPRADDAQRLRLLRASSIDRVLVPRTIDQPGVRLAGRAEGGHGELFVYVLDDTARQWFVAETVHASPNMSAAVDLLASPAFDPERDVLLPAGTGPGSSSGGSVRVLREDTERVELEVTTPEGGVLLAAGRTWLPIWSARVDDRPTDVLVANVHRMGVEVPAGTRRVVLEVDRTPTRLTVGVAVLTAIGLLLAAAAPRRRSATRA